MTPIQLGFSVDGENLCCKVVIIILEIRNKYDLCLSIYRIYMYQLHKCNCVSVV